MGNEHSKDVALLEFALWIINFWNFSVLHERNRQILLFDVPYLVVPVLDEYLRNWELGILL